MEHRWSERICRFDELTLDVAGQRACYLDIVGRRLELRQQQVEQRAELRRAAEEDARRRFYEFCEVWNAVETYEEVEAGWIDLVEALAAVGVSIPERPDADGKFRSLVLALLSVKLGRPVGFRFKKLVEVLHTIAERHKDLMWHVGWALKVYDRAASIASEDRFGKWADRQKQIGIAMKAKVKDYAPYTQWGNAVAFLFPEMARFFEPLPEQDTTGAAGVASGRPVPALSNAQSPA